VLDYVLESDRDAFRKILQAYGLSLRSYVATQIHTRDAIDDLAQDMRIVVYRTLHNFADFLGMTSAPGLGGSPGTRSITTFATRRDAKRPWRGSARRSRK
jgi:hypothetical protein